MTFLGGDHILKGLLAASPITFGNCIEITKLLSDHADFLRIVFGVKTVSMYCVDAFFLSVGGF